MKRFLSLALALSLTGLLIAGCSDDDTTTPEDTTAPGNVTAFTATPGAGAVQLAWTIPGDDDYSGVKILFRTDGLFPSGPADPAALPVPNGNSGNFAAGATSFNHADLAVDTYNYAAFAFDEVPNYASGATAEAEVTTALVGSISGILESSGGATLGGVDVTAGGVSGQTNEQGWFQLTAVPVGDVVVEFALTGYLSTFRTAEVLADQTTHLGTVVLLTAEVETIAAAAGGLIETAGGEGSVEISPSSIVTEEGDPYDGDVDVEVSAMLPNNPDYYESFPGDFEGIDEDGNVVQFVSYGFMGVNLYGEDRAPLQLGDGETAELSIQIIEGMDRAAPDTIPMWWFDEEEGVWREEGYALKVETQYVAQVEHFTLWNWDYPISDICTIEGTVLSNEAQPVADARVISQGLNVAYLDEAFTNALGQFSVRALKNSLAEVWAIKGGYASTPVPVEVGAECPVVIETALQLLEPGFSITLAWGAAPPDLDSHLYIPMNWDENYDFFHIAYYNMGTLAGDPYTALDTDDVSSYGPEIISGFSLYTGTYSYFVHNYCCGEPMGASPATVTLQMEGIYRFYEAAQATGSEAGWWHVFDFTVGEGEVTVTDVNAFEVPDYSAYTVYPYGLARAKAK